MGDALFEACLAITVAHAAECKAFRATGCDPMREALDDIKAYPWRASIVEHAATQFQLRPGLLATRIPSLDPFATPEQIVEHCTSLLEHGVPARHAGFTRQTDIEGAILYARREIERERAAA